MLSLPPNQNPNSDKKGILIPLFKPYQSGSSKFSFAIDFGTTNTHIEYGVEGTKIIHEPFEITESDIQLGSLHKNNDETENILKGDKVDIFALDIKDLVPKEFLPEMIGKNNEYKFPIRTVITENIKLNFKLPTYTLADFNISFVYEKTYIPTNLEPKTNLKWSNFRHTDDNKIRVEKFIEKLIILMRNKVLLNGGDLNETKIIWFYPSSMSEHRRNTLENAWKKYSSKYFSNNVKLYNISESIAPYYYLSTEGGISSSDRPVACIDIGGGTTDIVVYKDDAPILLTSFKFAANSIFGDGYGNTLQTNGFVKKYYPILKDNLNSNDGVLNVILRAMEQIKAGNLSQDLITFFFSLENNKLIKSGNYNLSFSDLLKNDEDNKVVFVMFYAAIMYHLAKIMKAKNMAYPRFITFTGTGSKTINIADNNKDLKNLTAYTKIIFNDVYNEPITTMELKQYDNPKEITCKGGLLCNNFTGIDDIKTVLLGDNKNTIIPETKITYKEINNDIILNNVLQEVELFIDKFFGWNEQFNYYNKFGANPAIFEELKSIIKQDLYMRMKDGLNEKLLEVQDNSNIPLEETLFFYPLVGVLHKMAQNIFNKVRA